MENIPFSEFFCCIFSIATEADYIGLDSWTVPVEYGVYDNHSDPRGSPASQGFELANHRPHFACHWFRSLLHHIESCAHSSEKTDLSAQ
jgi:hypothetical protein